MVALVQLNLIRVGIPGLTGTSSDIDIIEIEMEKLELARQKDVALAKMQRELEDALKETFPDKNKIEELRSQIAQLEEQDSSES